MIKSVWVKNYRSIADSKVYLEPITILVGHNLDIETDLITASYSFTLGSERRGEYKEQ